MLFVFVVGSDEIIPNCTVFRFFLYKNHVAYTGIVQLDSGAGEGQPVARFDRDRRLCSSARENVVLDDYTLAFLLVGIVGIDQMILRPFSSHVDRIVLYGHAINPSLRASADMDTGLSSPDLK